MIRFLRKAGQDLHKGRNLDQYSALALIAAVFILDIFNLASVDILAEITLAILALVVINLSNTQESIEKIDSMVKYTDLSLQVISQLTYLETMFGYLRTSQYKHKEILNQLITKALSDESLHSIPWVNDIEYLHLLRTVVGQCDSFQAVQDKPISWYEKQKNNEGKTYLQSIKNQKIQQKRRIFLISEADKQKMEEDLKSDTAMKYYWDNTGVDMDTYYLFEEDFRKNYPNLEGPRDSVIFDDVLFIEYYSDVQTLRFKMLDSSSKERNIFKCLDRSIEEGNLHPFVRISPPPLLRAHDIEGASDGT
jgi:hypothetical protein